jgi:CRP/FNR family transcriptional regulator, cyclic AMP receptor protein
MDVVDLLAKVPHFTALSRADREALAAALVIDDYPDGHVFIRQGEKRDGIFFVVEGEVAVTARKADGEQELNRMRAGDLFGLVARMDSAPRSATCRAAGPVRVGELPGTVASMLFNRTAPIAYAFQKALAMQLARDFRNLDRQLRSMLATRR